MDIAVGGSTLFSATNNTNPSLAYIPLPESGGTYPSLSFDYFLQKRYGFNVEASWRDKQATYYHYESYRPIFVDANAFYERPVAKKTGIDLLGGVGFVRNNFYLPGELACGSPSGPCYTSSTHFMEHLGLEVHYYFWHHFFVRPEAHYYHVQSNTGFNSDNVLRVGASIGFRIGPRD
jgi:hypothetical protein